jgi:ribose transport system ATP-binding protein
MSSAMPASSQHETGTGGTPGPPISIRGLRKSFGPTLALAGIDLDIRPGQVLGLMGPNGAGKSTLIKILDGVYARDSGTIELGGHPVRSLSSDPSVAFIHQDLGLVDGLSIAANLQLGRRPMRSVGPLLALRSEREFARRALERLHIARSPDTLVGELSPGEKTLLAIARAMSANATVLFVDEATSTLPRVEARQVTTALRQAAAAGATVVMVTHKLHEVLEATDRVVLLVDGRIVADRPTDGLAPGELVEMLMGHALHERAAEESPPAGETVISCSGVYCAGIGPIDLTLRRGEVVGLTGLLGSGLYEVAGLAHGSLRPHRGEFTLKPGVRRALLPPHRETQGGFDELTGMENVTLTSMSRWLGPLRLIRRRAEKSACAQVYAELSVRPPDPEFLYGGLSGGNKQKVLFGRMLLERPDVYVLCEPTRGVDVRTRHEIYGIIRRLIRDNAAVLLVSSDAEDLMAVCDRVGVVHEGGVADPVPVTELSDEAKKEML